MTRQLVSPTGRGLRRAALCGGVSAGALLAAGAGGPLHARPFYTLAQALAAGVRPAAPPGTAPSLSAGQQAARGIANLQAAASRISTLSQALAAQARAASGLPSPVTNGLGGTGLVPATGYQLPGSGVWVGVDTAQPVVQTQAGGTTDVTVNQVAPQAILNWQSFNVGRQTHLTFNQSAGGASAATWVVLNRITAPDTSPTQILGSISAIGQVYVLNQNGVLFAAGSQVNVRSLAAGAVLMSDQQFLTNGIYGVLDKTGAPRPSFTGGLGTVQVDEGAEIVTAPPPTASEGGGFVMLLGGSVRNDGSIATPSGQTILAAGSDFTLRQGFTATQSAGGTTTGNTSSTVLGSEIATTTRGSASGLVTNTGLIEATTGDITLVGHDVLQNGVLLATTSVSRRGTIHLLTDTTDSSTSVTLAPNSVTQIAPDPQSGLALASSQQAKFKPQVAYFSEPALLNDQVALADLPGASRIEITTGGVVDFQGQSVTLANGGQVAVSATGTQAAGKAADSRTGGTVPGRVFAASGAEIDVSGLNDVSLPIEANLITVNIQGSQLRDAPLNRDASSLFSNTIQLDMRSLVELAGTAADPQNRFYTAGGLLQVSGELGQVQSGIDEWLTVGGTITLSTPQVVAQPGAEFDIAGGTVLHQAGYVPQTYLVGPGGVLYDANTAPGNLLYSGVYGGTVESHARWHVTRYFTDKLTTPAAVFEPGYLQGRDGGQLLLSTPTAVFEGTIDAGVQAGAQQVAARPALVGDPFLLTQQTVPLAGGLELAVIAVGAAAVAPTTVTVGAAPSAVASALAPATKLPAALVDTADFAAAQLAGLGRLTIDVGPTLDTSRNAGSIAVAAPIDLAQGGSLLLAAPTIALDASVTARSGSVTLETENPFRVAARFSTLDRGSLSVAPGVLIDTSGTWTNAAADPSAATGSAGLNGGPVTLRSTGLLDLAAGSAIDASAGAYLTTRATGSRFVGGQGGNITLAADDPAFDYSQSAMASQRALQPFILGASLRSIGVTGGGTLSLTAPSVVIGDAPVAANPEQLALPASLFGSGFASYVIDGFGFGNPLGRTAAPGDPGKPGVAGVTVLPGTTLAVTEPVLQMNAASQLVPSGVAPETALSAILAPEYIANAVTEAIAARPGASLTLESAVTRAGASPNDSGGILVAPGATITVDPQQNVTLTSFASVVVDGRITAPSGTISVLNTSANSNAALVGAVNGPGLTPDQRSELAVWIGPTAVLDVSAHAVTGMSAAGLPFGIVPAAGTIVLGSPTKPTNFEDAAAASTDAFVFVRPGATLEAAGTSATIVTGVRQPDNAQGALSPGAVVTPVSVSSAGGTITFSSYSGIYLDGAIVAPAGGPLAPGGTLGIELDLPALPLPTGGTIASVPAWYYNPRRIQVSQDTIAATPSSLQVGDGSFADRPGVAGQAAISQAQIAAGGFANLFLLARDQIVFDGNVALTLGQSVTLAAFAVSQTPRNGNVSIAAPYVLLSGAPALIPSPMTAIIPGLNYNGGAWHPSAKYLPCLSGASNCAAGTFTVTADLVDLTENVRFGASGTYAGPNGQTVTDDQAGYNAVDLVSRGDIRFVPPSSGALVNQINQDNGLALTEDTLVSSGDVALSAAQIYPATGVTAGVVAGYATAGTKGADPANPYYKNSFLAITRSTTGVPEAPLSVFGTLSLYGQTIQQGGIVRAPLGAIRFDPHTGPAGLPANLTNPQGSLVAFLPGSDTSVSAAGLTIPFGGTTDGITYSYDGQNLKFIPAVYGGVTYGQQSIAINAINVTAAAGATLDLRGGGVLTGGGGEILTSANGTSSLLSQGFISGRGGSTDILYSTLLTFSPQSVSATQTSLAQNPVYAIDPALPQGYAPTTLLDAGPQYAGSLPPMVGEQITIPAGVPGLPAGTYTLLPSYYALLPGGYRVQFGAATGAATSLGATPASNGSTNLVGQVGVANTPYLSSQPVSLIVTSGTTVRNYSQYDEEGYATTAMSDAATFGNARPYLPQDAGLLLFTFEQPVTKRPVAFEPLSFAGTALLQAAPGGYDGDVIVQPAASAAPIEILADGAAPTAGDTSLSASSLNAFHAPLLMIGGEFNTPTSPISLSDVASSVTLRQGATLTAGAVWLFGTGNVAIEPGAAISTLGQPAFLPDSSTGAVFSLAALGPIKTAAAVVVANGRYDFLPAGNGPGRVSIGACATASACAPVTLASNGIAGIFAGGPVGIATNTVFAAPTLVLSAPTIGLGAPASGASDVGFDLTRGSLNGLLRGGVQTIDLVASQSIDVFGSLDFTQAAGGSAPLRDLILNTPALYGAGLATDTATIVADQITWTGTGAAPGLVGLDGAGTGQGNLVLQATQITLGYSALSQPQNQTTIGHLALGFANVDLIGTTDITGNNHASLAVYQAQGAWQGTDYATTGGNLTLTTPLLTTAPGAIVGYTAGGNITLASLPTTAPAPAAGLGGELDFTGASITDAALVALPSGKLSLAATGDVTLAAGARVDLAGPQIGFFDVSRGSWGGTLLIDSATGNITEAAGASIDISAQQANAGSLTATAIAGTIDLAGSLLGGAAPGYIAGNIDLRAQNLGDFAALNRSLDAGLVGGTRDFELLGPGDLTIGNEVVAQNVSIAVDQGSLTLDGTIDATGAHSGNVRLAASNGLTLTSTAAIRAAATVLPPLDSSGQVIAAESTPTVELSVSTNPGGVPNSSIGTLVLDPGATIDVSSPDGVSRGKIELNVPRLGAATSGDAAIEAAGPLNILGAASLAVNAFRTYAPSNTLIVGGTLTQADLTTIGADSLAFMNAAVQNGALAGPLAAKLAGLAADTGAFHLRPGVEIDSAPGAGLTVLGDLDLSGFRYAGVNPFNAQTSVYGSGEPGVLWLRAAGTLDILGSINDGFLPPPPTPDDAGWYITSGRQPQGQGIVLPVPVDLGIGTEFPKGVTLGYAITLPPGRLAGGVAVPVDVFLATTTRTGQAFVANVAFGGFAAGALVPAGTQFPAGTLVPAGARVPFTLNIDSVTWPAGVSLAQFLSPVILAAAVSLNIGDFIPGDTKLKLVDAAGGKLRQVDTRSGATGQLWGVSPLLPAGDLSWSLRLVGGAALAAADSRATQTTAQLATQAAARFATPGGIAEGSIALSDLHRPNTATGLPTVDFSVLRTGTGSLDLLAGADISELSPFGVYTAGTQAGDVTAAYNQPRTVDKTGSILGKQGSTITLNGATYDQAVAASYQANYPVDGGNVVIQAGGNIVGDVYQLSPLTDASLIGADSATYGNNTSNWLWWQGSAGSRRNAAVPGAWWINFGTFTNIAAATSGQTVALVGFTGFGALGGGNVGVFAGGDAGQIAQGSSTALDIAVASTGRADPLTALVNLTGGGDITTNIAGSLNLAASAQANAADNTFGTITDTLGQVNFMAASIGNVELTYDPTASTASAYGTLSGIYTDPRRVNPFTSQTFLAGGGPDLVLGEASVALRARGDLVLSAVGNPTLDYQIQNPAARSVFSLWQNSTAVTLDSAGGNVVPTTFWFLNPGANDAGNMLGGAVSALYPPNLDVIASSGSVYFQTGTSATNGLELAPAPRGDLQILAGTSIFDVGNGGGAIGYLPAIINISGAPTAAGDIPSVLLPARAGNTDTSGTGLFSFELDVADGLLHQGDPVPARFYAVTGDIVGLETGEPLFTTSGSMRLLGYVAAKAVQVKAGRDVVSFGASQQIASIFTAPQTGIVLNNNASDVSTVQAGRDVINSSVTIAGPGLLDVQAGRNVTQEDVGVLDSIGEIGAALTPATRNSGAGITVLAGLGIPGIDTNQAGFAALYFDPANLANPAVLLQNQPGKVERTYQTELRVWLLQRFGINAADDAAALAAFQALPPDQQQVFVLSVYFAELNQSGLDYNNPASRFYRSYIEGQNAIRALFPATDATGKSAASGGNLSLFSGFTFQNSSAVPQVIDGGIRTDFGGAVTTLVPYGQTLLGNYGVVPGTQAGVVTQGFGDINAYSYGSVILGQSRILTTFGGNILIWLSSDGEINAGRGSSTTALIPPLSVSYDQYGNALLSPTVPSSGAGIGTLAPIPQVPAGNLNLIAPFGTIDAGEAGIRASGNANLAALFVVNAANINVKGSTVGIPTVTSASAAAQAAASSSAGAATQATNQAVPRKAALEEPSIVDVQVLSIGGDGGDEERRKRRAP